MITDRSEAYEDGYALGRNHRREPLRYATIEDQARQMVNIELLLDGTTVELAAWRMGYIDGVGDNEQLIAEDGLD